jgi:hypothetical protein
MTDGLFDPAPVPRWRRRAAATTLSLSGYATAYETGSALTLAEYAPRLPNWPNELELKVAVIADIHACYP